MNKTTDSVRTDQTKNKPLVSLLVYGYITFCLLVSMWMPESILWAFSGVSVLLVIYLWRRGLSLERFQQFVNDERTRMEEQLIESGNVLHALFYHNPNPAAIMDRHGRIVKVNAAAVRVLGYSEEELAGRHYLTILPEDQTGKVAKHFADVFKVESPSYSISILHKKGYPLELHGTSVPIKDQEEQTTGSIVICQDFSASKRAEDQIRYLAYYDDLTGLPNRRLFMQHLSVASASSTRHGGKLAVFFIDIDRFKIINDNFGHDYGDMLLVQVAERFTRCLTDNDFLARTEGDEFVLFLSGLSSAGTAEQVEKMARKVTHLLDEPFMLEQYQLHITASVGIAIMNTETQDTGALMKCADLALSCAKEKGKNNYQIYNHEMKSLSLQRLTLDSELRRAIARKELILHFQPQMNVVSGRIIGFEALIRWMHPERGMILPGQFIPFAEESGLIVSIGDWVLREACRLSAAWQKAGLPPIPVAVNLSARQFMQNNLYAKVSEVLCETGLDPSLLEFEITESSTMDIDHATTLLHEMKKLGVNISIDDFGTGYSSFSYLKKLPIDKLKIDRSFVSECVSNPNDAAIVASIISMTKHLNLRVSAEGVETEEQLEFLRSNQCDEIQGYFFSRPVSADEALRLMERQAASEANEGPS
ncbi:MULTISPECIES: EAL domain-containing protein [unclassified Paenibacillus]|uniref:putative bifunctional diguanylate cyclase/phosphodiesterase n=1 Tax=unclassified Paenibacillus TaxID=185978 RepID=UPI001AE3AD73|nr:MULTISPECIES: EAL domain-containing protein [unclassified Paenibacillus]MBP1154533.1 diguanylate cyclase (GGDEF)-like protein/PAS domain S-box-containing protein [Paenibacillus sp. PvP091]MBP1170083.1 diguanylate cyclase (GGDEF)-like protein/PAS domain S-box-containing protein [Paenibacillus sp. PvR098]MBP2441111.1 diguanylate cyclase (GGDEF)-like protein/PAS domain S-box-containing protein [Paenibacillus sp. PvP052]